MFIKAKAKDYAKVKSKGNLKDVLAARVRAKKQLAALQEQRRKERLKRLRAEMEELVKVDPIVEEPMEVKPKRRAFDFD